MAVTMAGRQTGKSIWTAKAIERLMRDMMNRPVEELVCSESKVFGARYYCVEPVGGNWLDMEAWCIETFGNPSSVWDGTYTTKDAGRWYKNDRRFWFRNVKDRDWFIIRWNA